MASKPFDVTLKNLIEAYPAAWAALVGRPPITGVEVRDADLATVTGAADKVVLVHGPDGDWLLNLEVQSSHKLNLPDRLHLNSTLLHSRHGLLVHSAVVLLRREAQATNLTGLLQLQLPGEETPYASFRYQVVRVWELPVERLLTGELGLLPLAPLTDAAAPHLSAVLQNMEARLRREATAEAADQLRASVYILMGLRYPVAITEGLFAGVRSMEDSVTYQYLIAKGIQQGIQQGIERGIEQGIERGELVEAKKLLLRLGHKRFGPPDSATQAKLDSLSDLARLEQLSERLLELSS